jgi:hypothetical protein
MFLRFKGLKGYCQREVAEDMNHNNNIHTDTESDGSDDYFADVGFMFESQQPVRLEKFRWNVPTRRWNTSSTNNSNDNDGNNRSDDITTTVQIALHVADDHPGAVQSGHYLWPAATMLSEYLIKQYNFSDSNDHHHHHRESDARPQQIKTVIELGAGCAMVSFVALQLWKETLQCICITDHDPSTLVRARDNYETTIQLLFNNDTCCFRTDDGDDETAVCGTTCDINDDNCDEQLNTIINPITNIPVIFESLKWGDTNAVEKLLYQTLPERLPMDMLIPFSSAEHCIPNTKTLTTETNHHHHFDIVLGSDLIYCKEVVRPLFTTAVQLMQSNDTENFSSCFILAQSFIYDAPTENEIDDMCTKFQLKRTIVIDVDDEAATTIAASDNKTTRGRIQQFCFQR